MNDDKYRQFLKRTLEVVDREFELSSALSEDTHLVKDLKFDSLQIMQLVAALEDEFNIELPVEELADVETLGDAVRLLLPLAA